MRASLDVLGWALHFSLNRDQPAQPQPQGDVYASAERAEPAGEDVRMPPKIHAPLTKTSAPPPGAGFQQRMEATSDPWRRA